MQLFRDIKRRRVAEEASAAPLSARLLALAGIAWAFPLTMFGLLLALPIMLGRGQLCVVHASTPALLVSGRVADAILERHPFGAMCAMAIGHVVIADRRSLTPQILTHELEHVRQAALWFAYFAASLWAVLHGRDAYWSNIFEVAARKAEKHA
jgi:hypothetical protein